MLLVRFLALKDSKAAYVAGVVAFVWGLCVYWGAVTVGLFARAMAQRGETWTAAIVADNDVGLVVSAIELLPGVLSGLVLAGDPGRDLLDRRPASSWSRPARRRMICMPG